MQPHQEQLAASSTMGRLLCTAQHHLSPQEQLTVVQQFLNRILMDKMMTDSSVISITYGNKLHVVNDALLEGPGVCMQHQGHNHDEEYNMSLDVNPQGWPKIHHCYQQQVAQQKTTFPPVVLVPAGTDCSVAKCRRAS